jgi:hypothetical protein
VQIHIHHDPQQVAHLVGQVFQQLGGIRQTDHLTLIVQPQQQTTALRIGKATHPTQVVIAPGFFPFGVLGFLLEHRVILTGKAFNPAPQTPEKTLSNHASSGACPLRAQSSPRCC